MSSLNNFTAGTGAQGDPATATRDTRTLHATPCGEPFGFRSTEDAIEFGELVALVDDKAFRQLVREWILAERSARAASAIEDKLDGALRSQLCREAVEAALGL